jgi:hypothetical protein
MAGNSQVRRYFQFYWPLALTGSIGLSGMLVKNFVLLGFEDGVRELALYALAWSVFLPLQSATWMVSQAVNVLVDGRESLRRIIAFFGGVVILLTCPLVWLGFSESGKILLGRFYTLESTDLEVIQAYVRGFIPLPLILTALQFVRGLLVQVEATRITTALEAVRVILLGTTLAVGVHQGWSPLFTLIFGQLATDSLNLALHLWFLRPHRPHWRKAEAEPIRFPAIWRFFWPVALTTLMFSFSRPIILSFITELGPEALPAGGKEQLIAGLSLAFGFIPVFMNPINQFRNVFVNFARDDLAGVVTLLRWTIGGLTGFMLLVALTGLDGLFFRHFQGARPETSAIAENAFLVACLLPLGMGWRNYYHGLALAHRRTTSMGFASIMRNVVIYLLGALLLHFEFLNAGTAMSLLLSGFLTETAWMIFMTSKWRRALP